MRDYNQYISDYNVLNVVNIRQDVGIRGVNNSDSRHIIIYDTIGDRDNGVKRHQHRTNLSELVIK